jgi:hypothetical protein
VLTSHVDRPLQITPAVGTLDAFHKDCLASTDGRNVLKDKGTLGKLLANTYCEGGHAWNGWKLRTLTTAEMQKVLTERLRAKARIEKQVIVQFLKAFLLPPAQRLPILVVFIRSRPAFTGRHAWRWCWHHRAHGRSVVAQLAGAPLTCSVLSSVTLTSYFLPLTLPHH